MEIIFVAFYAASYFFANGSSLLFFVSICLHHEAFYKIFHKLTCRMDVIDGNQELEEHIFKTIRFHVSTKRFGQCVF